MIELERDGILKNVGFNDADWEYEDLVSDTAKVIFPPTPEETRRFGEYSEIGKKINLNDRMLKPATLNGYGSIIGHHSIPTFGAYSLPSISADDISIFGTRLLTGGAMSAKSVRNILVLLNKILSDARKASRLKTNPMAKVDKPRVPKKKKGRALTYDEFNAILSECRGRLRLIFLTSCMTGMRRGETLGSPWENIDFDNSMVKMRQQLFWKHGKHQHVEEVQPKYVFISPKSVESVSDVDLSPVQGHSILVYPPIVFANPETI
jgi:integrase